MAHVGRIQSDSITDAVVYQEGECELQRRRGIRSSRAAESQRRPHAVKAPRLTQAPRLRRDGAQARSRK